MSLVRPRVSQRRTRRRWRERRPLVRCGAPKQEMNITPIDRRQPPGASRVSRHIHVARVARQKHTAHLAHIDLFLIHHGLECLGHSVVGSVGQVGEGSQDHDRDDHDAGNWHPVALDHCPDDAGAIFAGDCEGLCTGDEPVNVPFDTAENTTSSVSGPCNFGCFGYWSDTAEAVGCIVIASSAGVSMAAVAGILPVDPAA